MNSSFYKDRLFELLPRLYHACDKGHGSLGAFLSAIGETLDDMERNIIELNRDSFIETCHEWVIPYLGRLIGADPVHDNGGRSRREVMNTIGWRKRKGTLRTLEEMVREITGWGVTAVEFFEQSGRSQNLNFIKPAHLQSPDLRDRQGLFRLGGARNRLLHNADIRQPCRGAGWFHIRNIGFFLSTAALSRYNRTPMAPTGGYRNMFDMDSLGYPVDLFDGQSGFPLSETTAVKERFDRFGIGRTVDIYSRGVPAAASKTPAWKGTARKAPPDASILNLMEKDGLLPMDFRVKDGKPLKYTITPMALHESDEKVALEELGSLYLGSGPLEFTRGADGSVKPGGRLVIRVAPDPEENRAFPGMVLRLKGKEDALDVFPGENDRRSGVYKDRLYACLPSFRGGSGALFAIDRYGSAYACTHNPDEDMPDDGALFDFTRLARPTEGVVYPSRKLTASTRPAPPVYSLAADNALHVVDRGQFRAPTPTGGWEIKAWNRDNQPGGGVLRLLSSISVTSDSSNKPNRTAASNNSCESPGHLIISIHRASAGRCPEMEVIVTDERGKSLLVYLPQVDDATGAGTFFYAADDGATYRVNATSIPGGLVVSRGPGAGPDGAFNPNLCGRFSAGQCLPIEGETPVWQRMPIRCDLIHHKKARPGFLAIDPVIGRAAFPETQTPEGPLTAGYYHGLQGHLGAEPAFHDREAGEEERIIRVSKRSAPNGWRHLRPPADGVVSRVRIFNTIEEAFHEAARRGGAADPESPPWIIRIEDSEIYNETFTMDKAIGRGLILRTARFQRPVWTGGLTWKDESCGATPFIAFQGLFIGSITRFQAGGFEEIRFEDCTLLGDLEIGEDITGMEDRYPKLLMDNCIMRGRLFPRGYIDARIENSALDPNYPYNPPAILAEKGEVRIDRCTVTGKVTAKTLRASESIFLARVEVLNPQKGCIRYSRITKSSNTIPRLYKCTTVPVTFCSAMPRRSNYLKLKRNRNEAVTHWAENGGEIGVHHQSDYTLKQKNLMITFKEYLPVGLKPVLIDIGG